MTPTPRTDAYLADLRARWAKARRGRQPGTTTHRAGERTVPGYVRHWARQTPDRPAFVAHGQALTYRELDEATDRLAGWLESRGVRPGDRVAVCSRQPSSPSRTSTADSCRTPSCGPHPVRR
ncbi:AMP-binding protein [Streptomyces sp. NRRL S-646]|uniref:AMP-binding protein n=1 Tax=Streptomyces sp. NRRL S-646 TaxID=1463917 RepID=UPI00099B6A66